MRLYPFFFLAFFTLLLPFTTIGNTPSQATTTAPPLLNRTEVQAFINKMVNQHHFDEKALRTLLRSTQFQPQIITSISHPAEKLPWHRYQALFLTPERVAGGVQFWKTYAPTLAQAQRQYGVPPEIIVAILGIESYYGKRKGQHPVLDSLVTLAFDYPPRAAFFQSELAEFLLLAREEHWDPRTITGSYAGAMGYPQFIASSYRHYAVDFNQDGKRDLLTNHSDAIGSIAHYFQAHGWEKKGLIAVPAKVKGEKFKSLLANRNNPKPQYALQTFLEAHITPQLPLGVQKTSFALLSFENTEQPEYWLTAKNFYVITRYNHSDLYAMAVYNLSQKIKEAYLNDSQPS